MINPIQQNVSFAGAKKYGDTENFSGGAASCQGVKAEYDNAVNEVLNTQKKMNTAIEEHCGKNFNIIA